MRKIGFYLTLAAFFLTACSAKGVTPSTGSSGGGAPQTGYMTLKFTVNGQLNFSKYQYAVVFNTSGNGTSPLPGTSTYSGYSDEIAVGGNGTANSVKAAQWVPNANPGIPPALVPLNTTPSQLTLNANSNGSATQFSVTFQRSIFTATAGAPAATTSWLFNAFVEQSASGHISVLDSMGQGGATDTTWVSPVLNASTSFDQVVQKIADTTPPVDPSAQLVSVEFSNTP